MSVFNGSATTSTGTITYKCGNADHNITITVSTGSSGTFANRTMKKSTENLTYNLYRDAAFATVWGDGRARRAVPNQQSPEQHATST